MGFTIWIDLATPIMLAVLSFFAWRYRQTVLRRVKKEERLDEELFKLYEIILEPYQLIMGNEQVWKANKKYKGRDREQVATSLVLKPVYQEAMFKLTLIAPHYVVKALNKFHLHFRKMDANSSQDQMIQSVRQLGKLLRAIRRGFGHNLTPVTNLDMIKWFVQDFDDFYPRRFFFRR